jgi:hypothetical protein
MSKSTDDRRTLTMLIIGPSGHGKSWVGATTPTPRLIIDLEGRAKYTPAGREATFWDGLSDPMQLQPSPTHTYIVTVTSMQVLATVRQWLRSGKHPFVSVTMDSLMEAQMRTSDDIRPGAAALQTQDWGTLLRQMEAFVREVRDLTLEPATGVKVAVFIAGVKNDNGFMRPLMQGQISSKLPYFMDVCGYLEKVRTEDGEIVRRLWIDQRPQNDLEVKDGTDALLQKYGPCIVNPNLTEMYEAL